MNFKLAEEQEMLKKMAQDFLTDKCPKTLVKKMWEDEKGYPPELWQEMAGLGWMGLTLPEKYGGTEMKFIDLAVLLEEMARACLPGPFFSTVVLGALPVLEFGTDAQKQAYLPGISSGKMIFTMALTEADANYGGDCKVKAISSNSGYNINGAKLFVPDANAADYLLCVARTDEKAAPESGLTVFIVDAKSQGISKTVLKTIAHDKLCEVVFKDVKVPKENILGKLNHGWAIVEKVLQQAAVAKSCQILGSLQQMLDMTVAYAKERVQYDHRIGSFQVIQHYCAIMATDVDGVRYSTYEAAWKMSEGLPCRQESAIAKAWANEAFSRVSTYAHQIHGAIGVTIDHDLHFYTRQAAAAALSYGSGDVCREIVAQEMGL